MLQLSARRQPAFLRPAQRQSTSSQSTDEDTLATRANDSNLVFVSAAAVMRNIHTVMTKTKLLSIKLASK